MINSVSRRDSFAGVAATALAACAITVPSLARAADPQGDSAIVTLWREWSEVADRINETQVAAKWARHRGLPDIDVPAADEWLENDLHQKIRALPARTPAGFLCKLDVALQYGPAPSDFLEDLPWIGLLALQGELEGLSGLHAGWPKRNEAHRKADDEIHALEQSQREWAREWIAKAEACGQPLTVCLHPDGGRALTQDEPLGREAGDDAFRMVCLSAEQRRAVADELIEQDKFYMTERAAPSRSKLERQMVEIFRRAEQRKAGIHAGVGA